MKTIDSHPDSSVESPDHDLSDHGDLAAPNDSQTRGVSGNQLREVADPTDDGRDPDSLTGPPVEDGALDETQPVRQWSGRLPVAVLDANPDDRDEGRSSIGPDTAGSKIDPTIESQTQHGGQEADEDRAIPASGGNDTPGNNGPPNEGAPEPDGHDDGDEGDNGSDKATAARPKWVETRTTAEIEALKDKEKYTNEDLAELWKSGDPEAAAAYLSRNSGYIHTVVRRNIHIDEHRDPDEVLQQYELHLLRALQSYRAEGGAKSLTYAGDIAEKQLQSGRDPSRDSVGAQPRIRAVERRVNALDRMLELSGGYTEISGPELERLGLTEDQTEALRRVEERVRTHGYSPLSDDEVLQVLGRLDVPSSSSRYMSTETLRTVRQHHRLTGRLLSTDHSAPEYPVWLGQASGKVSDDETTSHARPVLEGPQIGVDEAVEQKMMDEALRAALPGALETLEPREREILHMRVVQGLAAERVAEQLSAQGDPITRQRIYQIEAGILDPSRDGSARGTLFRYRLAEAADLKPPRSISSLVPDAEAVLQARQTLTNLLPSLSERHATILNDYFLLDGRDTSRTSIPDEIAQKLNMPKHEVSRIIRAYVSEVRGSDILSERELRKAMLEFAPIRHPLSDEEKQKWGIAD